MPSKLLKRYPLTAVQLGVWGVAYLPTIAVQPCRGAEQRVICWCWLALPTCPDARALHAPARARVHKHDRKLLTRSKPTCCSIAHRHAPAAECRCCCGAACCLCACPPHSMPVPKPVPISGRADWHTRHTQFHLPRPEKTLGCDACCGCCVFGRWAPNHPQVMMTLMLMLIHGAIHVH